MEFYNQSIFNESQIDASSINATDANFENVIIQPTGTDGQVFEIKNVAGTTVLFSANTSTGKIALPYLTPNTLVGTDSNSNLISSTANYVSAPSGLTSGKHIVATGSTTIANSSIVSEGGGYLNVSGGLDVNINNFNLLTVNPNNGQTTINDLAVQPTSGDTQIFGVYSSGGTTVLSANTATNEVNVINLYANEVNASNLTTNRVLVSDGSQNITSSGVTTTTLGYLDATSSIQTQLNNKQPVFSGLTSGNFIVATSSSTIGTTGSMFLSGSAIQIGTLVEIVPSSSGSAFSIFNYPLTKSILSVDSTTGTLTSSQLNASNLTSSTAFVSDSSKNIISSATTAAQIGYLSNVTSDVQAQINSKQPTFSGLTSGNYIKATSSSTIGNGTILSENSGTLNVNGSVAVVNSSSTGFTVGYGGNTYFVVNTSTPGVYVGGTTPTVLYTSKISTTNPGSNVALITDGSYNIAGSTTTSTELGYVHGVTSAIQTQLNGKQPTLSSSTSTVYINNNFYPTSDNAYIPLLRNRSHFWERFCFFLLLYKDSRHKLCIVP